MEKVYLINRGDNRPYIWEQVYFDSYPTICKNKFQID